MEQTGKGMASRKTYVILAITWIIFLIIYIILGSGVQAFRFSGGSMMTAFIAAGSLAVFIIALHCRHSKALGMLCLILGLFSILETHIVFGYTSIDNPFTSQQFAAVYPHNLLNKGQVTYYRRSGPFLYAAQRDEEIHEFLLDYNYIHVYEEGIIVSCTFLSPYADYSIHNDKINLRGKNVEKWELGSFVLHKNNHTLAYTDREGERVIEISNEEYKKLTDMLECMPLGDYELTVEIKGDDNCYCASVDGEEVITYVQELMDIPPRIPEAKIKDWTF